MRDPRFRLAQITWRTSGAHDPTKDTMDALLLCAALRPAGEECSGSGVIMEVLEHAEIGLTMSTYAHVLPVLRQEAADAMDELFGA